MAGRRELDEGQPETLLRAAGLRIEDPAERARIIARHGPLRAGIELLYATPGGRYEDFGLIFAADPPLLNWRAPGGGS